MVRPSGEGAQGAGVPALSCNAGPRDTGWWFTEGIERRAPAGAQTSWLYCALGVVCTRKAPAELRDGGAEGGRGRGA